MGRKQQKVDAVKQAQNLLRPFFNSKRSLPRWKQFSTIRKTVPATKLQQLYSLTEDQKFFSFQGLGNTFPINRVRTPDGSLRNLEPLILPRELTLEIERLNFHRVRLAAALAALEKINSAMLGGDFGNADTQLTQFESEFGFSIIFAKKRLLCTFQTEGLPGLLRDSKKLIGEGQGYVWGGLCNLYYDMADRAIQPGRKAKQWLRAAVKLREDFGWFRNIYLWEILSFPVSPDNIPDLLLRYNGLSLIDLLFLVSGLSSLNSEFEEAVVRQLDPALKDALLPFRSAILTIPSRYLGPTKESADVGIYRVSFFFAEFRNVTRWRAELAEAAFSSELADINRPIVESPLRHAATVLRDTRDLEAGIVDLKAWLSTVTMTEFDANNLRLSRTIIIAELLAVLCADDIEDDGFMVSIIAQSEELQEYITPQSISALLTETLAERFPLLTLFLRDLLFKRVRSLDNDLERRTAFMDLYRSRHADSIAALLDQIAVVDVEAAHYVARICTRTFLERLFLLMSSVKDVLQSRIIVCGWLIERGFSDSSLDEEKDALTRELDNLDTRSDLDSTRVHVDEEALREWFAETQYASAARYTQTVLAEGSAVSHGTFLAYYNEEKRRDKEAGEDPDGPHIREGHIGPEFVLLDIVERTLHIFVTDRSFGIDSYLSRRIRHGTLSGFLMTPVARSVNKLIDAATDPETPTRADHGAEIAARVVAWKEELSVDLDRARREFLQVKNDEHPDGLIYPTWRTGSNVKHLDAMISRVRERVIAANGVYDIFPDVYALCWDLIETDLGRLRSYLFVDFLKHQVEKLSDIFRDFVPHVERDFAVPYFRDIHSTLSNRIQEICGWFVRPVFRRDNYNLRNLVDSTISIIRELQESYDLTEDVRVSDQIDVNRHLFELVGDILYVLVGNAAKHAAPSSTISVIALAEKDRLLLGIRSKVASDESFDHHWSRIQRAVTITSDDDLHVAAVGEGFTGIRKILGLLDKLRSSEANLRVKPNRSDQTLDFIITIPIGRA